MINPGEREKQDQQRWQDRFARGRMGLSASVEEALADPGLNDGDDGDDVCDEPDSLNENAPRLVRPRLSLQSKPLPAVSMLTQLREQPVTLDALPVLPDSRAVQSASKKKRLAGRNTRVELQAMPKQEKKAARKTVSLAERAVEA